MQIGSTHHAPLRFAAEGAVPPVLRPLEHLTEDHARHRPDVVVVEGPCPEPFAEFPVDFSRFLREQNQTEPFWSFTKRVGRGESPETAQPARPHERDAVPAAGQASPRRGLGLDRPADDDPTRIAERVEVAYGLRKVMGTGSLIDVTL